VNDSGQMDTTAETAGHPEDFALTALSRGGFKPKLQHSLWPLGP
jgi:hypothetical protein